MSSLREHAEDYLVLRRALGFKLVDEGYLVASFVTFLEQEGEDVITSERCVAWTMWSSAPHSLTRRMRAVRSFARYLHTIDPRTEVPSSDLFPKRQHRPTPHIYTDEEVVALMASAGTLQPPLRAATLETLIGLLAATGLRVGEALALDTADVDWDAPCLRVRHAKFDASREVLLDPSSVEALRRYVRRSDRPKRTLESSIFVTDRGTRVRYSVVQRAFSDVRRQVFDELAPSPRLHDLRHSFAVHTLLSWYRDGGDVASRMPLLSTYLGHVRPVDTYWYLSAVPELLTLAAQRQAPVLEGSS